MYFARAFKTTSKKMHQSEPAFKELDKFPVSDVHNGYFAQDKKGKWKDDYKNS